MKVLKGKMNKPLISVIIPIYKVEQYLTRCVDSILSQTYDNLEVFLVDDGSPDKCGLIADEYKIKDSRVNIIHKKNGGLSDARNVAIPIVKGEYISFVDSDDWVSPYYIENLYNAICRDNSDISMSWFKNVFSENDVQVTGSNILKEYYLLGPLECLEKLLYQNGVETSAWGKLYKKDIISDLRYPVGKLYEDIPVTYAAIKKSTRIALISNIDYYYFQRSDSIQNETFNVKKLDGIFNCRRLIKDVVDDYPELYKAAVCRYFGVVCNILFQIKDKSHESIKIELWNEVKKYRMQVMKNDKARLKNRIAALLSFLGYHFLRSIYLMVNR